VPVNIPYGMRCAELVEIPVETVENHWEYRDWEKDAKGRSLLNIQF
jgi:hypothetical protein